MEQGEATETIAITGGGVLVATMVVVGLVWGRNGQAVLYAALLLIGLLSPVVIWIWVRRA